MFGEKPMIFNKTVKADTGSRIIVPRITGVEANEELVIIYNQDIEAYEIYSIKSIEERISEYSLKAKCASIKKERIYWEKKLYELCSTMIGTYQAKGQNNRLKISTGKIFKPGEEVVLMGAVDHIIAKKK